MYNHTVQRNIERIYAKQNAYIYYQSYANCNGAVYATVAHVTRNEDSYAGAR